MAKGLDTAVDLGKHLTELKAKHLDFVIRYYRYPTSSYPGFSHNEALLLSSLGLQLVACWEFSDKIKQITRITGARDAGLAFFQADQLGQPRASCIYFCIDTDATAAEIKDNVIPYFHGVVECFKAAAGTGKPYDIGAYGSGLVCETLLKEKLVTKTWLANATGWARSGTFKDWNMKQGHTLAAPFDHDEDEAVGDFGAFTLGKKELLFELLS